MPRYFFDIQDADGFQDFEGTELADLKSAQIEAVSLIGNILSQDPAQFWEGDGCRVDVCDESRRVLFILRVVATIGRAD